MFTPLQFPDSLLLPGVGASAFAGQAVSRMAEQENRWPAVYAVLPNPVVSPQPSMLPASVKASGLQVAPHQTREFHQPHSLSRAVPVCTTQVSHQKPHGGHLDDLLAGRDDNDFDFKL